MSSLLQFQQGIQQILQIVLTVEFQLEATLALAIDDLNTATQVLASCFSHSPM